MVTYSSTLYILNLYKIILSKKTYLIFKYLSLLVIITFLYQYIFSISDFINISINYNYTIIINHTLIILFNNIWTNMFILLLIILYNVHKLNYSISNNLVCYLIILLFFKFNLDDTYIQEKINVYIHLLPKINPQLLNNLVLIHPIYTHLNYAYLLLLSFLLMHKYNINFDFKKNQNLIRTIPSNKNCFILILKRKIFNLIIINIVILTLGGFWALQELI